VHIVHIPRRFVASHWGGTETVLAETCRELVETGHTARIFCPDALSDRRNEVIHGIEVRRFSYFYPYFGLKPESRTQMDHKGGNLFSFSLMSALKKEPGLDLIHLHTLKRLGGIGRHVAIKRRVPYVVSLHGGVFDVPEAEAAALREPAAGAFEWGKILGWWVGSRRVLDDAGAIICVGEGERMETQRRYPDKRVVFLPNGVDADRFARGNGAAFREKRGIAGDAFLLLNVGRIDAQKNQIGAVKALHALGRVIPSAHLALIGPVTGEAYHQNLMETIDTLGVGKQVTVIPGLPAGSEDLLNAYHAADVFFLPSVHEPFGIVILEAWAAGLPVVASRVGGIPSFVEDGLDGLLADPSEPEAFVPLLKTLAGQKDFRRKMAEAGYHKAATRYSWKTITRTLVELYQDVIRDSTARR
jgi:glycosyltransferase involved in cell wall biosynthesis